MFDLTSRRYTKVICSRCSFWTWCMDVFSFNGSLLFFCFHLLPVLCEWRGHHGNHTSGWRWGKAESGPQWAPHECVQVRQSVEQKQISTANELFLLFWRIRGKHMKQTLHTSVYKLQHIIYFSSWWKNYLYFCALVWIQGLVQRSDRGG